MSLLTFITKHGFVFGQSIDENPQFFAVLACWHSAHSALPPPSVSAGRFFLEFLFAVSSVFAAAILSSSALKKQPALLMLKQMASD